MTEGLNFNAEFLNTNGGDVEEVKKYCASHYCYEPRYFEPSGDPCPSNRNGKCMVVEFMKAKGGGDEAR